MHSLNASRIALFRLGSFYLAPGARSALLTHNLGMLDLVARHARGDWGDLDAHDREVNRQALVCGGRLMSVYNIAEGVRIYIITEADRSITTMLLPSEY